MKKVKGMRKCLKVKYMHKIKLQYGIASVKF